MSTKRDGCLVVMAYDLMSFALNQLLATMVQVKGYSNINCENLFVYFSQYCSTRNSAVHVHFVLTNKMH